MLVEVKAHHDTYIYTCAVEQEVTKGFKKNL